MTQQLWYTWSANGYGSANGARVRAATSELTKVEGPRVRSYIPLLEYTLPDATDRYLPPAEAPLCLAFLKAAKVVNAQEKAKVANAQEKAKAESTQEAVLIQKVYTGLDYVRRPGNFFSHLLTDLPPVLSSSPARQLPFSAREAISFWRSSLWRSAEGDWPPGELRLNPIPSEELFSYAYTGPLNGKSVADISSLFKKVFSAFLTLAHQNENKRLYLVGQPEIVATLIWGITHALPRTLPIMQNLTFSTFEANVETDAKPLIVGTCWQPNYPKQGSEQAALNLPSSYYQSSNTSGIAIHCTTLESTPFNVPTTLTPLLSEYLQFVQDCFADGSSGLNTLSIFLTSAEKRNIIDLPSLFHRYVEHHKPLAAEDVTRILQRLFDKALKVSQQIESVLQEQKDQKDQPLLPAITLYNQIGNIQAEVEDFMRENVQSSLLNLLYKQPEWWTSQGEKLIKQLYQLSTHSFQEQHVLSSKYFVQRVLNSKQWKNQQGADLLPMLTHFAQNQNSESAPGELLREFTKQVEYQQLYLQQDLKKALLSLGETLIDQLGQVIRSDQTRDLAFWQRVLNVYLNSATIVWPEIWIHLLKTLSVGMRFNSTYQAWWRGSKQYIRTIHAQAQKLTDSRLNGSLTSFASSVSQSLLVALQTPTIIGPALSFWGDLFQVASPPSNEPIVWASFLNQLSSLSFTPHYQQWYNEYGEQDLKELVPLARQHTESSLPQSLETFRSSVSAFLLLAVRTDQKEALTLFNSLLLQIAPPESTPIPWLDFLFELRNSPASPGFVSWWELKGQETISTLRTLADKKSISPELQLLPFVQQIANLLFKCLKEEITLNQHTYDETITYLLALLTAALPTNDAQIWPNLLQLLSQSYLYLRIRWELRAELLRHWKTISILNHADAQAQISLWLKVSWPELDPLLSLNLPRSWQSIALAAALETYQSTPVDLVLRTISHHYKLFEDYLQTLLQKAQTEPVLSFFAFLTQHDYERKLPLLELLLETCNYELELSERLLQSAHITSNEEITTLLEQHCPILLSSNELPPTMLQFLERYMTTFDLDRLDNPPTQNLFIRLKKREQHEILRLSDSVRQAVEGWYTIVDFLTQPGDAAALRIFTDKLLAMPRLETATQKKLATKLVPALVPLITTEAELSLVLYVLSPNHNLDLLQQMAKRAGELFGKTDIPIRIALYVRIILAEGNHLSPEERDPFVALCFQALFKDIKKLIREKYFPEPLWHRSLMESWQHAMEFHNTFVSLKKALNETANVPDITSLYQPAFDPLLNEDEREVVTLARRFIAEYDARNDQAMLQAHENLKQHYLKGLRYTPDQTKRIELARQKNSPSSYGQSPAIPNSNRLNSSEMGSSNDGNGYPQNVVLKDYNPYSGTNQTTQPASYQIPQNMSLSSAITPTQVVAEILGNKILLETLDITMEVKKAYLQMQLEQKQRDHQLLEATNSKEPEKKPLQREINEILNLLNDVMKLRQRTLSELIDDVLIQQELQKLSRDPKYTIWYKQFDSGIEQIVSSYFENLKKKLARDDSWNFQDNYSNEKFKQALRLFIRYEAFQAKCLRGISMEDWAREDRKTATIDYKVANIPKPKSGISGIFRR